MRGGRPVTGKYGLDKASVDAAVAQAARDTLSVLYPSLARVVEWRSGSDVPTLAGRPVRLRIVMKEADLYALRFVGAE